MASQRIRSKSISPSSLITARLALGKRRYTWAIWALAKSRCKFNTLSFFAWSFRAASSRILLILYSSILHSHSLIMRSLGSMYMSSRRKMNLKFTK